MKKSTLHPWSWIIFGFPSFSRAHIFYRLETRRFRRAFRSANESLAARKLTFVKSEVQKRLVDHEHSHSNHKKKQTECEAHGSLARVIPSPISRRQGKQHLTKLQLRNMIRLTHFTLTSVCTFSILFSTDFLILFNLINLLTSPTGRDTAIACTNYCGPSNWRNWARN